MLFELIIVLSFGVIILIVPTFNMFDGEKQKKVFSNRIGYFLINLPHLIIPIVISKIIVSPLESLKTMAQLNDDSFDILFGGIYCIITGTILLCFIESLKRMIYKKESSFIFQIIYILFLILIYPLSTIYVHLLSDSMNIYFGIIDCFNNLLEQGIFNLFNGIHFYLLQYKIKYNENIKFWKRTIFEYICLMIVSLLTYPLLTLQIKSQKFIQLKSDDLFDGIFYVPFIIFLEIMFKNMFESITKYYFHFKYSNLPL
eukprot:gene8848-798_t